MELGTLNTIIDLSRESRRRDILKVEGEPDYVYYVKDDEGNYEYRTTDNPRAHKALDASAVVAFAVRFAANPSSVWFSREAVVACLCDAEDERRETCTLSLSLSKPMLELLKLEMNPIPHKQMDAVRLLRTTFHGCLGRAGEILLNLRALNFVNNAANNAVVEHGRRNVSSSLVAEVTGRSAIPEFFSLDVPVFANGFPHLRGLVEVIVDIDEVAQTIKFIPAPGSIELAIAGAERQIGEMLQAGLDRETNAANFDKKEEDAVSVPPVYYGKMQ